MSSRIIPLAAFSSFFAAHLIYSLFLRADGCGPKPSWITYITQGDVFLGFSLALGGAFTAWSIVNLISSRSMKTAAGAAGGTALVAGIGAMGCFFSGCCGSPMLIIYAGILGVSGLTIPKWSIATFTLLCTLLGCWFARQKGQRKACCTDKSC